MFVHHLYPFNRPVELDNPTHKIHDVAVVGAGPVGLTLTLALAKQGIRVILLDHKNRVSDGSRAICFSKRSLEIFDKLGVAEAMMDKGIAWNVGRIYFQDQEIDQFDLTSQPLSKYPAFINLPQYYVEHFLITVALEMSNIEIRWLNTVQDLEQITAENQNQLTLMVETPEGSYQLHTRYLIACDGSRSTIRDLMNLEMLGQRFEERFLIADFRMEADLPAERWFWFNPPFTDQQSIMLLKQPDSLWRIEFEMGRKASEDLVNDRQFIKDLVTSVVGHRSFELDWTSIYHFSCKMLESFVHNRAIFAGDSAHVVSPFGARGANSGIEDADNLSWKLAQVLTGQAEASLLETYNAERTAAASQNVTGSAESSLFIAPPSREATKYRNEILDNALTKAEAKKKVNCGRLSVPATYGKYLNSEQGHWPNPQLSPGRAVQDCEMSSGFLIEMLGYHFTLLTAENSISQQEIQRFQQHQIHTLEVIIGQNQELVELYQLCHGSGYLFSPDLYIVGRWKSIQYKSVMDLYNTYQSGRVLEAFVWQKTEQEMIDEKVAAKIRQLSGT